MGDFKRLLVWHKAHALAIHVHRVASRIRGSQNAALRSQLTRAAQSISANLAEGCGQQSAKDFARFVSYAINSGWELENHLITGKDIRVVPDSEFEALLAGLTEVRKMSYGLRAYLARKVREEALQSHN